MQGWLGPRQSAEDESARRGRGDFVCACVDLVLGAAPDDAGVILALGGPPALWVLTGRPAGPDYWLRVWALRGLLWVWEDSAASAVSTALSDEQWRVREMAAKVVARHRVDAALERVTDLRADPVARVRSAASRAVAALTVAT